MTDNFKIHSICVVKNEADIIEHCLQEAARWSDYIYVYDGSSSDGTWEKVQALQSEQIIPWKQHDKTFHDCLRGEVFNTFKHRAQAGDWWCRLDADEFYVESPKSFLAQVKSNNHVVWGIAIAYYLTLEQQEQLNFDLPIAQLLSQIKHYKVENSEARFFRHRPGVIWHDEHAPWPKHMGVVNRDRILYRHYRYRSPQQIQLRLDTRQESRARGAEAWAKITATNWQEKLVSERELHYDDGSDFKFAHHELPQHLESFSKRTFKKIMHGVGAWA